VSPMIFHMFNFQTSVDIFSAIFQGIKIAQFAAIYSCGLV